MNVTEKRQSNKERLLALLQDGRSHHQRECMLTAGYRYGARIFELRREGYMIETQRIGDDVFAYQLCWPVEPVQGQLI